MNPIRSYLRNLNDKARMKRMYPHHPMQGWERVAMFWFAVLCALGLLNAWARADEAEVATKVEQQKFLDFLNRKYVLTTEDGHTVFVETLEIGRIKK